MTRLLAGLLALSLPLGAAWAGDRQGPRLCPEDLPDGAHLPPQPGCTGLVRGGTQSRGDGTVHLGGGTSVRLGGRASAGYGATRR